VRPAQFDVQSVADFAADRVQCVRGAAVCLGPYGLIGTSPGGAFSRAPCCGSSRSHSMRKEQPQRRRDCLRLAVGLC
jgi:hypothetical protein